MCDARGIFWYVNAGSPGGCGDACVWNASKLKEDLECSTSYDLPAVEIAADGSVQRAGTQLRPQQRRGARAPPLINSLLVGDSAFKGSERLLKGYEHPATPQQRTFNYSVCLARRVIECAWGRTLARFPVLRHNRIYDPRVAARIAAIACALNNILTRHKCPFERGWLPEDMRGSGDDDDAAARLAELHRTGSGAAGGRAGAAAGAAVRDALEGRVAKLLAAGTIRGAPTYM